MKLYNVGILGATGAVGQEMMKILLERKFPVGELRPIASARSAGSEIDFGGRKCTIVEASDDAFEGLDIVLGAAENDIAERFAPAIVKAGAVFVDKDGKAFTVERYRALFYNVLEACGIDNPTRERDGKTFYTYTPHSCRHTFATLMKRVKGADKDKLELIGHTSDDMLRYYQDVNYTDLRKITDAL